MENTNIEKTELIISANDLVEKMSSTSEKNASCEYLFNGKKINELMEIEDDRKKVEKENELISCIINNFINKQFENTIVLTGAGASIISNDNKYKGYSGKTVSGLTEEIYNYLSNKKEEINIYSLEELVKEVKYLPENEEFDLEKVNIEDLLSKVESAKEYLNLDQVDVV
jgi:gas vesicle protein